VTLALLMNLDFAASGVVPPPIVGQSPRASRYRVGYRVTDIVRPVIVALVTWGLC
jgi:hypothetical protein